MHNLFTIGHSNLDFDSFYKLLDKYKVEFLVDVRSIPYSKFSSTFNRENLMGLLKEKSIQYIYMGNRLGARRENLKLYSVIPEAESGTKYFDFEKVRKDSFFEEGIENLEKGVNEGKVIAIMCTEKDPFDCHRAILVARALELHGVKVNHIIGEGKIQTQEEIENRLLKKYFPKKYFTVGEQLDIFNSEVNEDEREKYVEIAYQKRNIDIAHTMNGEETDEG